MLEHQQTPPQTRILFFCTYTNIHGREENSLRKKISLFCSRWKRAQTHSLQNSPAKRCTGSLPTNQRHRSHAYATIQPLQKTSCSEPAAPSPFISETRVTSHTHPSPPPKPLHNPGASHPSLLYKTPSYPHHHSLLSFHPHHLPSHFVYKGPQDDRRPHGRRRSHSARSANAQCGRRYRAPEWQNGRRGQLWRLADGGELWRRCRR